MTKEYHKEYMRNKEEYNLYTYEKNKQKTSNKPNKTQNAEKSFLVFEVN